MRVVSLVPSATETLLALGVDVVACTRFCEQPAIRHVGGTKNPDIEAIVALAPDLVVRRRGGEPPRGRRGAGRRRARAAGDSVRSVDDALAATAELARRTGRPAPPADRAAPPRRRPARAFVPIWRRPWMTINGDTYGASVLRAVGIGS